MVGGDGADLLFELIGVEMTQTLGRVALGKPYTMNSSNNYNGTLYSFQIHQKEFTADNDHDDDGDDDGWWAELGSIAPGYSVRQQVMMMTMRKIMMTMMMVMVQG